MDKAQKLKQLSNKIERCKVCREGKIGKQVFGEGSPDAQIMFIGEAPGREEAKTGRPFVGRSGKLLRSLIKEAGLKEKDVYITSPVKYLPSYGTPTKKDVEHAKLHFEKQLKIINPKIIVLLGSVAYQAIFGKKIPIIAHHGEIIEKDNRKYFITLHPAAAVRFVKFKTPLLSDFKKLKELITFPQH